MEPLVAREPVQPPVAVQAVALVDDQFRVEVPPLATLVGLALNETVGGVAETVTVADCDADPLAPVQVSVKVEVVVSAAVLCVPLVGRVPLHPPEAVQLCAFCALHCKVVAVPMTTLLLVGTSVTAGIATLLPIEPVGVVWTDADAPQAASADNAAHTSAQRNMCDAWQARHAWE